MVLISADDPFCKTISYDTEVIVTCTHIHGRDDLSNAQRDYSDGKSDTDATHLFLYHSDIPSVSEIFAIFPNVGFLYLGSNSLNFLNGIAFKNATVLKELYLGSNNISLLHNGIFVGAQNLIFLNFNNNKLRTIDSDTFVPLRRLEHLDLSSNGLTYIHPQAFQKLTSLSFLSLANNLLTDLHVSTFQQLINLQYLLLNGNNLKLLDGKLLSSNSRLRVLDIGSCGIQAVGGNFFDNIKLLNHVKSERNDCIDEEFYDITNISSVISAFQLCFDNYDDDLNNGIERSALYLQLIGKIETLGKF